MTNETNNQMELKLVNMLDLPNILSKSVEWVPVPVNEPLGNEPLSCWFTRDLITPLYHNLNMSKNLYARFNALYCFGHIQYGTISIRRSYDLKVRYNMSGELVDPAIPIFTDGENYYGPGGLQYVGTIFFTQHDTVENHSEAYEAFENGLMSLDYFRKISKVGLMSKGPWLLFRQNDELMDAKVKSVLDEAIAYYTLTNRGKGIDELLKELIDRLYN